MIDALELVLDFAAIVEGDQCPAMGTPVLEAVDGAVDIAHHDDRHRPHNIGAVVAFLWNVGLEADEVPGRAFEQALQLAPVICLVLVDPVGDPGDRVVGPGADPLMSVHGNLAIRA